jgi:hypothetical protein
VCLPAASSSPWVRSTSTTRTGKREHYALSMPNSIVRQLRPRGYQCSPLSRRTMREHFLAHSLDHLVHNTISLSRRLDVMADEFVDEPYRLHCVAACKAHVLRSANVPLG